MLKLVRVKQWYKNVVVFLGPIFGGFLTSPESYPLIFLGFILCCFASSSNYVINDILDVEKDRSHPEKAKSRPLAAGIISKPLAIAIAAGLLVVSLGVSLLLNWQFFIAVLLIVVTGQLYNATFKHHAILDIISLSMIYEWRAIAGCYLVNLFVSPWLFVLVFLAAMFLVLSKRKADLDLLGDAAGEHKRVYEQYNEELLNQLVTVVTASLFIVYCVYAILGPMDVENGQLVIKNRVALVFSIPVAMYIILRYLSILHTDPAVARNPEKAFKDKGLLVGGIILILIWLVAFYLEPYYLEFLARDPRT
ncbi:MAG: UbiA prenyltransferase family protein [Promethearchaeota archaeon]